MRSMLLIGLACGLLLAGSAACQAAQDEEGWVSLFNGKDLAGWKLRHANRKQTWQVVDGALYNSDRGSDIHTEQTFKDFKLHIEFKVPRGGNSGVYLRGRYELQVADSFGRKPGKGGCGALYGKFAPAQEACKKADEWQSFDVTLVGMKLTVLHNGIKIHDEVTIPGHTGGSMGGKEPDPGPLMLQGDHTRVWYRDIRIQPIE